MVAHGAEFACTMGMAQVLSSCPPERNSDALGRLWPQHGERVGPVIFL